MRLVFMGTPDYAVPSLRQLSKVHDILMVYTQPDRPKGRGYQLSASPIKQEALALKLAVRQPKSLRSSEEQAFLKELAPDVIVVIAYGLIIPQAVLDIPRFGCINAHGSILPKYRGASPMQEAILQGDTETGVTTMQMDAGIDTGNILLIERTPLAGKTIDILHDELADLSAKLLLQTLAAIEEGSVQPIAQDNTLASHTRKIQKADGQIHWDLSAGHIVRQWRAYRTWPGVFTHLAGEPLKLTELEQLDETSTQLPGIVIRVSEAGIDVATGDGVVRIKALQPTGKRAMSVADYLRGNTLREGTNLGD